MTPPFAKKVFGGGKFQIGSDISGGQKKKKKNLIFEVMYQKCVESPGEHHRTIRILIRAVFEELDEFSWTSIFFLYSKMNRI